MNHYRKEPDLTDKQPARGAGYGDHRIQFLKCHHKPAKREGSRRGGLWWECQDCIDKRKGEP